MNNTILDLTKVVFATDSLTECNLEKIKELAESYPYFSAAQLLLSAKLKVIESPSYTEQVEKTSLYITNPFWLDNMLNADSKLQKELEIQNKNESYSEQIESEEISDSTENFINLKLPDLNAPIADDAELPLSFEPYHRVDYFASQGIKVEAENVKVEDNLGKKLKSFTDWLKVMKKLPETEKLESIDSSSEANIINLAQHSLAEREIVTESMAEVWEKQGNHLKAIETYKKLSLLDPAKSTYFATKIEHLKK